MITVNIGDHDLKSTSEATSKRVIAIQITSHPMFNKRTLDNDIALIKLISAVPLDGIIRPVCLPPPIHDMSTRLVTASGWGKTTQSKFLISSLSK